MNFDTITTDCQNQVDILPYMSNSITYHRLKGNVLDQLVIFYEQIVSLTSFNEEGHSYYDVLTLCLGECQLIGKGDSSSIISQI